MRPTRTSSEKEEFLKNGLTSCFSSLLRVSRHFFAAHLLESGIDLRYIQELFGHKSSKTAEIYTHLSTRNLPEIKNPLDSLLAEEGT